MKKLLQAAWVAALGVVALVAPGRAGGLDAQSVLDRLKDLAGTWRGEAEGSGAEAAAEAEQLAGVVHEFRVSAAGTVVMETMGPSTEHEMINMYHVDGDDLLLTHYCAGGNQPLMRLDRARSTPERLVFAFAGGTNLDPAVDEHIHSAEITFGDGGKLESRWTAHAGGDEVGVMTFHLSRSR